MRRICLVWILLLLMGQTRFSVLADPPAQLPDCVSGERAQGGVTAQDVPTSQSQSPIGRKRAPERSQHLTQGVKAPDAAKTLKPNLGQPQSLSSLPRSPKNPSTTAPERAEHHMMLQSDVLRQLRVI